jgi:hypothetical protein
MLPENIIHFPIMEPFRGDKNHRGTSGSHNEKSPNAEESGP